MSKTKYAENMTSREMLEERLNGKTYREIGEMCGISRQAVQI
nr:MAG TPA_asm: ECF sigma factor [Caudoviricetes sp.]